MISAKVLAKQVERFALDNAPTILMGVGIVGSVSASILTAKATVRALDLVHEEKERRYLETPIPTGTEFSTDRPSLSKTDTFKLVWVQYLPPVGVLGVTVSAIFLSHHINTKRAAALAVAYSLNEKRFTEYREKVVEKFNPNKERQVRDDIAQDRVKENPPNDTQVVIVGHGDVLCHDLPTGRYFQSNMERLRKVQNDINAEVNEVGYSTLEFFYQSIGLKTTPYSSELGWTTSKMLDLKFSAVLTEEGQPIISITYEAEPIRGFRGCNEDPPF